MILEAAESLFKAMKAKKYPEIWKFLSQKTRDTILDDVGKALRKSGSDVSKDALRDDFASGGVQASTYWEAYLAVFDPVLLLEQSKWEIGKIQKKEGEIILRYKKSEHPTILKLFKEDDGWKVGMEETFRPRRWLLP